MNHDVYVLVPGILGSVLQKDGKDVFGLTAEAGFRALFPAGGASPDSQLDEPAWVAGSRRGRGDPNDS